jgi:hypothetical protein
MKRRIRGSRSPLGQYGTLYSRYFGRERTLPRLGTNSSFSAIEAEPFRATHISRGI